MTRTAGAIVAAMLLAACASDDGHRPVQVWVSEIYHFDSLAELVATSDGVILAHVSDVNPGRTVGDGHGALQFREVTLNIDEVLSGDVAEPEMVLEELGWDAEGRTLEVDGIPASNVGDWGIFFVHKKQDPDDLGVYTLINSQGRYLVQGDLLIGPDRSDPLVQLIETLTLEELKDLIAAVGS